MRYLQGGEDTDCKDGKCDADGDHHKPSCPAAHEPGCSVRGADCDCNTHTCGGEFSKSEKGTDEKDSCTCRKDDKSEKSVVVTAAPVSGVGSASGGLNVEKDGKDTLHLASVANLSLTRETNITSVASTPNVPRVDTVRFKTENVFTSAKFRSDFEQNTGQQGQQQRSFMTQGMDFTNSPVVVPSTGVATLTHFPSN